MNFKVQKRAKMFKIYNYKTVTINSFKKCTTPIKLYM